METQLQDYNDRKFKKPCEATKRSIYDKYTRDELRSWAKYLYIEALKEYHPDKHPENPRLFTEICQELGKAYQQALHILNRGQ